MTEPTNPSFAAIITITSPESNELARLRVILLPADLVPLDGGATKPLQECTLADLQQFADSLEKKLWDQHSSATLIDLVVGGEAEIEFSFADDELVNSKSMDLWLEHAIVFPDGEQPELASGDEAEEEHVIEKDRLEDEPASDAPADIRDIRQEVQIQEFEPEKDAGTGEMSPGAEIETVLEEPVSEIQKDGELIEANIPAESIELATDVITAEEEADSAEEKVAAVDAEIELPGSLPPDIRVMGLRRPLNHATWTAVDILANEPAFRNAQAHSLSSLDREVAGVLIGPQPEKQPDGRYLVHIVDTIIAKHTRMHGASVTYTPESWRYINDKLAERYPDESAVIVGWYHTHPGFGIFLSGMDLFIHQNFFTQKWHIAMVLDPRARTSGFFCWDRQMTKVDAYEFPWPNWASNSW
jgi:proteasome lid subunit RPN8/RPN11